MIFKPDGCGQQKFLSRPDPPHLYETVTSKKSCGHTERQMDGQMDGWMDRQTHTAFIGPLRGR